MTTILPSLHADSPLPVDAPAGATPAVVAKQVPASIVPNAPSAVTAEVAAAKINRSAHAGGFAGASLLRVAHADQSAVNPTNAAIDRLINGGSIPEFEASRHQADVDTLLASIADPAALFPRGRSFDHSPAAELRARFPSRTTGNYDYFHLLVLLTHGSDTQKAVAIADGLIDALPSIRPTGSGSPFSSYYDPVIRDDIGGMTYGVKTHRVLPALIDLATRLGPEAPFSKRLLAHVESDKQSRADVLGYFDAGADKVPATIRAWSSQLSVPAEGAGHVTAMALMAFAAHRSGRKPSPAEMTRTLTTMHPQHIGDAVETMHRELGLPYSSYLAVAVAPAMLSTRSLTNNGYLKTIATLGDIAAKAEAGGEVGARAALLAYVERTYANRGATDEKSVHDGVVHLLVKNTLAKLTLEDIDGVVGAYVAARTARNRANVGHAASAEIHDPLTSIADHIKNGSNTSGRDGQPAQVLARSMQSVLAAHGYGGVDGLGRYLGARHRIDPAIVHRLANSGSGLAELLTALGEPGSYYTSRFGFTSRDGARNTFSQGFSEGYQRRIEHESSIGYRLSAAWKRLARSFAA